MSFYFIYFAFIGLRYMFAGLQVYVTLADEARGCRKSFEQFDLMNLEFIAIIEAKL